MQLAAVSARLRALQHARDSGHEAQVRQVLSEFGSAAGAGVRLRRGFIQGPEAVTGSDTVLPAAAERPPASRLISSRADALRTELVLLFRAHCTARPGTRPSGPALTTTHDGILGLLDLTFLPARQGEGLKRYHSERDNRLRRLKSAIDILASPGFRLLTRAASTGRGRYRYLEMQREDRNPRHPPEPYTVPRVKDDVIVLPREFFTNGWLHVLTDREIVGYLMLLARGGSDVAIPAYDRVKRFGLGPDAYKQLQRLEDFGLVAFEQDPNRGGFGVHGYNEGARPMPHTWTVLADGLMRTGMDVVTSVLAE